MVGAQSAWAPNAAAVDTKMITIASSVRNILAALEKSFIDSANFPVIIYIDFDRLEAPEYFLIERFMSTVIRDKITLLTRRYLMIKQ